MLLVVNVASRCGLTPQYDGLEQLHRREAGRVRPTTTPDDPTLLDAVTKALSATQDD